MRGHRTPSSSCAQVLRKRHYLAELQQQAKADSERKEAANPNPRGGGAGGRDSRHAKMSRAKSLDTSPQALQAGSEFAARLKAEFEAALHQAHQQVAVGQAGGEPLPDESSPGVHAANVMKAMQRWEHIFTSQVSTSLKAVSGLNAHMMLLDEKLTTQAREKVLLRERLERAEISAKELHSAVKHENQAGLRQILDEEQHKARRFQLEIRDLKTSLEHVSEQQASLKVMTGAGHESGELAVAHHRNGTAMRGYAIIAITRLCCARAHARTHVCSRSRSSTPRACTETGRQSPSQQPCGRTRAASPRPPPGKRTTRARGPQTCPTKRPGAPSARAARSKRRGPRRRAGAGARPARARPTAPAPVPAARPAPSPASRAPRAVSGFSG